jgi:uncharacterized membrane protein
MAAVVVFCTVYALVLPAILTWLFGLVLRRIGWIKEGDLKL